MQLCFTLFHRYRVLSRIALTICLFSRLSGFGAEVTPERLAADEAKYRAVISKAEAEGKAELKMQAQMALAVILDKKGDPVAAGKQLDEVESWAFANARAKRKTVGVVLLMAGILNQDQLRYEQAERCLEKSYNEMANAFGAYNLRTSFAQGYLGCVQLARGDLKQARRNLKDAVVNLQLSHMKWTLQEGYLSQSLSPFGGRMARQFNVDYANLLHQEKEYRTEGRHLEAFRKQMKRLKIGNSDMLAYLVLRQALNAEIRGREGDAEEFFLEAIQLSDSETGRERSHHLVARQFLVEFYNRESEVEKAKKVAAEIAELGGVAEELAKRVQHERKSIHRYSYQRNEIVRAAKTESAGK